MNRKQPIPGFLARLIHLIDQEAPHAWAARMGIAKATMHGLLREASPSSATLVKIARHSNVSLTWLLSGRGPERLTGLPSRPEPPSALPDSSLLAPAWSEEEEPPAWMRQSADVESEHQTWVMVRGDGMEPTLRAGDWMLVDRRERRVTCDAIHLLELEGAWLPKRLQAGLQGEVWVRCDNPAYGPFSVPPAARSQLAIVGRVIWIGRRM